MFLRVCAFVVLAVSFMHDLMAGQRVALVVGCSKYINLPSSMQLVSPAADSADVAAALKAMGYEIVGGGRSKTRPARSSPPQPSGLPVQRGAEAAVFYYSGHGIQVGEDNYLLPVDTPKITGISQLKNRAVQLRDSFMVALEEAKVPTKVVVWDCCRDNPFASQLEAVMAQVGKSIKTKSVGEITGYGPGFYLAFATSPGQAALDGNGRRNSPFTTAFLRTLETSSGKDIDLFFLDVKKVMPADQVSWTNSSLTDEFALALQPVALKKADPAAQQAEVAHRALELAARMAAEKGGETRPPSNLPQKESNRQPKQGSKVEEIRLPFNLKWGERSDRLESLVVGAGGKIFSRGSARGGLKVVEVTGLPQDGLKKTIFYFKQEALTGVELQYHTKSWPEIRYVSLLSEMRRRITDRYGEPRSDCSRVSELISLDGLEEKSIYEWAKNESRVQLIHAVAGLGTQYKDLSAREVVVISSINF
jgi:uncharacterized caspase-like protein